MLAHSDCAVFPFAGNPAGTGRNPQYLLREHCSRGYGHPQREPDRIDNVACGPAMDNRVPGEPSLLDCGVCGSSRHGCWQVALLLSRLRLHQLFNNRIEHQSDTIRNRRHYSSHTRAHRGYDYVGYGQFGRRGWNRQRSDRRERDQWNHLGPHYFLTHVQSR